MISTGKGITMRSAWENGRVQHFDGNERMIAGITLMIGVSFSGFGLLARQEEDLPTMVFETLDGKYRINGAIDSFQDSRGKPITQSRNFSLSWNLIIRKKNGDLTPPVPLKRLAPSTISMVQKVFGRRYRKPSIESVFLEMGEGSLDKFVAFGEDLKAKKLAVPELKKRVRNFNALLTRNEKANPVLQCYLLVVQIDLGLPASYALKKITSEFSDFWIGWRCLVVSDLLERGGKSATGTLRKYQEYLVEVYHLRDEKEDNSDLARELTWVSDTARQLISLPYKNPALGKVSEAEEAFDVVAKISAAKKIREEYAENRESFDKINEAEKKEKLERLISDANREFDAWVDGLNNNWEILNRNFGLVQDRLLIAESNLQLGLNQYYSAKSRLLSISSRRSSAQSEVDRIDGKIDDEERKSADERDEDLLNGLRRDLRQAESEVRRLDGEYAAHSSIVSQLSANVSRLRSIYNGFLTQLQGIYYEICQLTNSARNYGKLFVYKYKTAIENDGSLAAKLTTLDLNIRNKLSQMPRMPEIKLGWKATKEAIKKEERDVAKDIMIRLSDVENAFRSMIKGAGK